MQDLTASHRRELTAEFLGTFALTFFGAGAICADAMLRAAAHPALSFGPLDLLLVASAHAVVLGVMVSALGHISGGHFNPAVTLGAAIGRHISAALAAAYIVTQLVAGIVAALLLKVFFSAAVTKTAAYGAPVPSIGTGQAFVVEAVLTFFLVLTVYATAIDPAGTFRSVAGFGIGLVLFFDILVGGPLTGAAMNPARAFGPSLVAGVLSGGHFVIYWIGTAVGGVLAALVYENLLFQRAEARPAA